MNSESKLRLAGVAAAVAALAAVAAGGAGAAGAAPARGVATVIKIKSNNNPHFVGPDTVAEGAELEIESLTDPGAIGPHTFSLVKKSELPKGKDEIKRCGKLKLICEDVAEAHEIDPNTFEIGEPIVEDGATGWDTEFDGTSPGDSVYLGTYAETHSRDVAAAAGRKLRYMCIVHPEMQDKIEVVSP